MSSIEATLRPSRSIAQRPHPERARGITPRCYAGGVSPRTDINRLFEASCSDVADDGSVMVFIALRTTGTDVVRLRVHEEGRAMHARYEILDAKLDDDDVVILFCETYLATFTDNYYADLIDTVTLHREAAPEKTFPYPVWS
jgi:hypothetical protein